MLRTHESTTRGHGGHNGRAFVYASSQSSSTHQNDPDLISSTVMKETRGISTRTAGLYADAVFSSRRQLNLHTYDPHAYPKEYTEVKIGGHPLDHRLLLQAESQRVRPHGPFKTNPRLTAVTSNQSLAFEARERAVLEYSPVKIGGHALDHVRFFDKGVPSRPLWGYVPILPPVVIYPRRPQAATPPVHMLEGVPRGLSNLYACSHCRHMRQSPRVQLCCGHALCASCISSDTMRHVVVPTSSSDSSLCLLECVQCDGFVAMSAVVFPPDRVFHVDHQSSARTFLQHRHHGDRADAASTLPRGLTWTSGSALAALVATVTIASGRLQISSPRIQRKVKTEMDISVAEIPLPAVEISMEDGAVRWQKRLRGLENASSSRLATYRFERTLGVGNFAEVMLVRDRKGALCVLKESDKLREAVNEMALLSKVRSPHVVRIHAYFVEDIAHRPFAYIDMEYCDRGDLGQRLVRDGPLNAATFDELFYQLCIGLQEIHAHGIVHRDLKPGNVLLTSDGVAKIADFGVSTCLESNLLTHHAAGTLAFMAPEVRRFFLGEDVSYDVTADIWSLGALAVAMLSGDPEPRVATRVADEVVDEVVEKHTLSDRHAALLRATLHADPQKRPSLAELLAMVPPMSARL